MASKNNDGQDGPRIIQCFIDTRPLWPVKKGNARNEVQELKTVASRAFSLLTEAEQTSVLKYYHLKDAKMSMVSHLLKHLIIAKCGIPWSRTTISRDAKGKPCFNPQAEDNHVILDFNVSHQAGIVSLIAAIGLKDVAVGTDIVCVNERSHQDYAHINKYGFDDWVDVHADVLADSEVAFMKSAPVDGRTRGAESVIERQLRKFYAVWCLREAYVKMTGDALLAPWLKDLEILDVQVPTAKERIDPISLEEGEVVRQFANYFQGKAVTDVKTELTAFGMHYMIAGSMRIPKELRDSGVKLGKWIQLDLEKDILDVAEAAS
ncbi:hypothetical protein DL98DRAFT_423242 [Cadophora sp. DSE1049]|nr:hypothetical protein DL98DRAFT_423242 [Cadophora sp. DSE1049]